MAALTLTPIALLARFRSLLFASSKLTGISTATEPLPQRPLLHGSSSWSLRRHFHEDTSLTENGSEEGIHGMENVHAEEMPYPGATFPFTKTVQFSPLLGVPVPCFRVMDEMGRQIEGTECKEVSQPFATRLYEGMATLQAMDVLFYEAQRQGRFSFYMTTAGEEAVNIGAGAALADDDMVFAQYREPGVLLWRGFSLPQYAHQCFSTKLDLGKGRQMPVHYGSRDLHFQTISSPLATQIPQAVGAAYAAKMRNQPAAVAVFFGEGAASEGDCHAGLNFAATLEVPLIFICRNNGWAISTPAKEQYRGDGIAGRGAAYGIRSLRCDGNDLLAVYTALSAAREYVVTEERPALVEVMTYRTGHHSTSDDSSRYRTVTEIQHWKLRRDPVARFRRWMELQGWWSKELEKKLRERVRAEVIAAMDQAEAAEKPPLAALFTDVYDIPPLNLREQEIMVRESVARYPEAYPSNLER